MHPLTELNHLFHFEFILPIRALQFEVLIYWINSEQTDL